MAPNPNVDESAAAPTTAATVPPRPMKAKILIATVANLALLLSSALALSVHHAYDFDMRVNRLRVEAPKGADFATLFFDVDLEQPTRWSPHIIKFHAAKCGFRARGVEVAAEVPEIQYLGPTRAHFQAKVKAAPSGLLLVPAPVCAIASSIDLFGTGLVVPKTVYKPLADATGAPQVEFRREGSMKRTGPTLNNSSVMLDQTVVASAHLPAESLPEFLRSLLGSAEISLNTHFAYAEANDGSVRLAKTIDASLDVKSDGMGGYEISLPVNVSCHIKPSLALTVGKMLVGTSRPLEGAPPADRSSVDRAVRFAAEEPQSPVSQLLGPSRVFGWRSHEASVVNDLARGARRRLGRRLARSLMSASGESVDFPLVHQGRRLMADTKMTLHETIYTDGEAMEIDASALLGEERMTISFEMSGGVKADLVASDGDDAGTLRFSLQIDSKEVAYVDIANSDIAGTSFSAVYKDPETGTTILDVSASENAGGDFSTMHALVNDGDGRTVADVRCSLDENGDDSASAKIYNSDLNWAYVTFTYSDTGSARNIALSVKDSEKKDGTTQFEMTADGTREGDKTETTLEASMYDDADTVTMQIQGSISDNYGVDGGFVLDASIVQSDGGSTMKVDAQGTHKDEELIVQGTVKDGEDSQMLKLNPLTIKYKETEYSVEATVHDEEDALFGSGKLSITGGTAGGEVKIDLGDPLDSSLDISGTMSVANPEADMTEVPCLQGDCEFSAAVHEGELTLDFTSKQKDSSSNYYLADVSVKLVDTEWKVDATRVFVEGEFDLTGALSLTNSNAAAAIEVDDFVVVSSGSLKDPESNELLKWSLDSNVDLDASSAGAALNVQADEDGQLKEIIDLDARLAETTSGSVVTSTGSVTLTLGGEEILAATAELKDEPNKLTATAEVKTEGEDLFSVSAKMTEDESAGAVTIAGSLDFGGDEMFGAQIDTLDTDLKASIQLVVTSASTNEQFVSFDAGIEFGATGSPLNDWTASCVAEMKNPDNTSAVLMSMSMTAGCSGSSFTTSMQMGFDGDDTSEMMSVTGTSAATEITGSGTVGGADGPSIEVAFRKQDGNLDTLSEMTSSVTIAGDDFSAEAGMAYDGGDEWGVSALIANSSSEVLDALANISSTWISVQARADGGAIYGYFNTSIDMVDVDSEHTEMWEINYLLTGEVEESSNITILMLRDSDEVSETSARSFVKAKNDAGVWADVFIYSFNTSTVTVKAILGNFKIEVPASKALAFVADPMVKRAFAVVIAEQAGVGEEKVKVWLSIVTSGSRRLEAGARVQVDYTITIAEKRAGAGEELESDGPSAADVASALQSVTVETFVTEFEAELQELGGASATEFVGISQAVVGSASTPTITDVSSDAGTDEEDAGPKTVSSAVGAGSLMAFLASLAVLVVQV